MTRQDAFQVGISSGGFRSPFRAPGSPRLSPSEKAELATQMARARQMAMDGDDSALRSLSHERYAVECVSDIGAFDGNMRKRKFSNPLFLTPSIRRNEVDNTLEMKVSTLSHLSLSHAGSEPPSQSVDVENSAARWLFSALSMK